MILFTTVKNEISLGVHSHNINQVSFMYTLEYYLSTKKVKFFCMDQNGWTWDTLLDGRRQTRNEEFLHVAFLLQGSLKLICMYHGNSQSPGSG